MERGPDWYAEQLAEALNGVLQDVDPAEQHSVLAAWAMLQQYADWRERRGLDPRFRDPVWQRRLIRPVE
jgi:hypothetical protein